MKNILYLLLLCTVLTGCVDLKSDMYDVINPGIFPKNEQDAEALVTSAAYSPFRAIGSGIFTVAAGGILVNADMCTDIGDCQWTDPWWQDILNVNFTVNTGNVTRQYGYIRDISKMTLTFERIENIDMDVAAKNRLKGELHCGRGWLAYLLYDWYGPVQIATLDQLKKPLEDDVIPRLSKEDMINYIETELNEAIGLLPANYKKGDQRYGRFTKGLAYTVLMKLYMLEKDWEKAEKCARELMKEEYGYGLVADYKDIFTLENEKNDEIIWACQCTRTTPENMHSWLAHVLSSVYPTTNPNIQKWGGYRVPWSFYNTFDKTDKRLAVLVGDFVGNDGVRYNQENKEIVLSKGVLPIKYGEDPAATGEESQVDYVIYRYADVLISLSEIIVRKNNAVTQEAIELLNTIRTRAGITPYTISDFNGVADFMEKILLNRGQEFWFEGHRRSDLIRHGKFVEYLSKYKGSATVQEYMTLMPLPQSVINEGKGVVIQNPGY